MNRTFVVACGLAGLVATPVSAQTTPPAAKTTTAPVVRPASVPSKYDVELASSRPKRGMSPGAYLKDPSQAARSYKTALFAAKCIANSGDTQSLQRYYGADDKSAPLTGLVGEVKRQYGRCAGRMETPTAMFLPSALAETLVLMEDTGQFADRALSVNVDRANMFIGADRDDVAPLDKVARCMAVYSPGLAINVLQSEVRSSQEVAALDALYSNSLECGNANRPDAIPITLQRGALALALYQWTHSPT